MAKLILKSILFVLVVASILALLIGLFPQSIFIEDYAIHMFQRDIFTGKKAIGVPDILIIGDSEPMTGIIPDSLDGDVRLMCVPGAVSPMLYYMLSDFVENVGAPDTLFLFISPYHLEGHSTFWQEAVKYKFFDYSRFDEILSRMRSADDHALGNPKISRFKLIGHWINCPYFYIAEIQNSLFMRAGANAQTYALLDSTRGYLAREKADVEDMLNFEATDDKFSPSQVLDEYLRELFDLCRDEGIHVIFTQMPMNESSVDALDSNYLRDFRNYIHRLKADYPLFDIDGDIIAFPDSLFADPAHLDVCGALRFTNTIQNRRATAEVSN